MYRRRSWSSSLKYTHSTNGQCHFSKKKTPKNKVFPLIYPNCNPRIICWTRYILSINHLSTGTYTPVNTDHIPNPLNFHFPSLLLLFFPFLLDLHTQNQRTWCHTRCQRVEKKRSSGPGFLYQLMRDLRETEREKDREREKQRVKERDKSYTICLKVSAIVRGVLHHPPVFSSSITPHCQDCGKHLIWSTLTLWLHCCHG